MHSLYKLGLPRSVAFPRTDTFQLPQALVVIADAKELPQEFDTSEIRKALADSDPKESFFIRTEALFERKVTILRVARDVSIVQQIAEAARELNLSTSLSVSESIPLEDAIEAFAYGFYKYDLLTTEEKKSRTFDVVTPSARYQKLPKLLGRKIESVYLARDLVNLPPNLKNPNELSEFVLRMNWKRTKVEVLDFKILKKLGFGMLLAVASGSDIPASVVVFRREWKKVTNAIVGKWVTFDAGGLQIKTDDGMYDMKMDMAGAAAVLASFWYTDAVADLPQGAIGAIGLVENLLGGSAFKPLDVVIAHNGLSVEIHHTDAEWRLVLGDVASYVCTEFQPKNLVSIATLTWACLHALGYDYAGLVARSDELADSLLESSEKTPERLWRLPLDKRMLESTKAKGADRKNVSRDMKAGASVGAAFIAQFVPETVEYAHLDIAGPAYRPSAYSVFPSEATGFWVLTLISLLENR